MTSNLPVERPESTPALLGGQAALFENPAQLLDLDDVALKELAVLFGRHGASVFAQVRAQAGLLAWAGWFRFGEVTYSAFLLGLSKDLGIQPDTLMKWRRDVVKDRKLAVPGVVKARSDAAKEGHKTAGQTAGAGRSSGKTAPIRATSKEVPLEPSGGAELQAPAGPTDGDVDPSLRSTPLDPPRNPTGPVPSLRQAASSAFCALSEAPEGIGAKWTVEEATYWENRSKREMDAWRKAHGLTLTEPKRRQGTISRPQAAVIAGRAITAPVNGSLTRRDVTPMFKP